MERYSRWRSPPGSRWLPAWSAAAQSARRRTSQRRASCLTTTIRNRAGCRSEAR